MTLNTGVMAGENSALHYSDIFFILKQIFNIISVLTVFLIK